MTINHLTNELEPGIDAPKTILYFTAVWCAPCKAFSPVMEKFKTDHPDIKVIKLDVDEKRDLVGLYGVRSVPTVIALRHGDELARHTGATTALNLEMMFVG